MHKDEPIEELYFNWLCTKVLYVQNPTPSLTYWRLFRKLHGTEFVWTIMGDDNRAADGKELRSDFLIEAYIPDDVVWRTYHGCSILEMLIAFAKRGNFQTDDSVANWFWEFIDNLGMKDFNDASNVPDYVIDDILFNFIWRKYDADGLGGLFPLENPTRDQSKIELWWQFFDYLIDQNRP